MTVRDYQLSFTDTGSGAMSLVNAAGTYLAPNSYDTSPLGTYLTENTAADTQLSGNVNTYRDLGGGRDMFLVVNIITAVTSAGAATIDFQLITSASSSLSSPVVMYDFGVIGKATLVAGYRLVARLPKSTNWLQWIGLQYVVGTATTTAGTAIGWIGLDIDALQLGAASGFSIK